MCGQECQDWLRLPRKVKVAVRIQSLSAEKAWPRVPASGRNDDLP